jgi:hypothetical protein
MIHTLPLPLLAPEALAILVVLSLAELAALLAIPAARRELRALLGGER